MKGIEKKIGQLLKRNGATISVAESCTGGLIAHRITNVSGSSDYFEAGIVSYSKQAKMKLLGIPRSLIDTHGAVSEPVVRNMAESIRRKRNTTLGLATTGVAGPLGGTPETPVGTVFIALATPEGTRVREFHYNGNRAQIKRLAAEKALEMVLQYSSGHESKR